MNGANLVVIERAGWMNDLILEHGEMKRGLKIFLLSVVGLFLVGSFVCGLGGHMVGIGWNSTAPVDVSRINEKWTVEINYSKVPTVQAVAYRDLLQNHCAPMKNGWRILFNQLWYNAITEGYDQQVWLEPDDSYEFYGYYGLYIWGSNVLLRNGFGADSYHDRVLTCDLPAGGWPQ